MIEQLRTQTFGNTAEISLKKPILFDHLEYRIVPDVTNPNKHKLFIRTHPDHVVVIDMQREEIVNGDYTFKTYGKEGTFRPSYYFRGKIKPSETIDEIIKESWFKIKYHHDYGPAISAFDKYGMSRMEFYSDGLRHRVDGPAWLSRYEDDMRTFMWFENGKRVLKGPAYVGLTSYYSDPNRFSSGVSYAAGFIGLRANRNTDWTDYNQVLDNERIDYEFCNGDQMSVTDSPDGGPSIIETRKGTRGFFVRAVEYYHRGKQARSDPSDGPCSIYFFEDGQISEETWTDCDGNVHREDDLPARIDYKKSPYNGKTYVSYEGYYDGGNRKRDNDLPTDVYYLDFYGSPKVSAQLWNVDDHLHRISGPACIEYHTSGNLKCEQWYHNGDRHRDDGPAETCYLDDGRICNLSYYVNGQLHREDGPASQCWVKNAGNTTSPLEPYDEMWCLNGEEHRIDGPSYTKFVQTGAASPPGKRYSINGVDVTYILEEMGMVLNEDTDHEMLEFVLSLI